MTKEQFCFWIGHISWIFSGSISAVIGTRIAYAKSIPNPFHIFPENDLLTPIVQLGRPAIRVIGNILRRLERPAFL